MSKSLGFIPGGMLGYSSTEKSVARWLVFNAWILVGFAGNYFVGTTSVEACPPLPVQLGIAKNEAPMAKSGIRLR